MPALAECEWFKTTFENYRPIGSDQQGTTGPLCIATSELPSGLAIRSCRVPIAMRRSLSIVSIPRRSSGRTFTTGC